MLVIANLKPNRIFEGCPASTPLSTPMKFNPKKLELVPSLCSSLILGWKSISSELDRKPC